MVRERFQRWHDMGVTLGTTAIVCTAKSRDHYLRETLNSWEAARGITEIHSFTLALGYAPDRFMPVLNAFDRFRKATGLGRRARVKMDSAAARASNGMHRAIGEAGNHVFADPAVDFVIFGEEDVIVSTDVLEYMAWARETFAGDERVLCVCAHDVGGSGWNEPGIGLLGADADQDAVQLLPEYSPWVWGTWRDRWEKVLEPNWDWRCDSGDAMTSGYDWAIFRTTRSGYLNVTPDASRSQNIGRIGGWAAQEADFPNTQAASFRAERSQVTYRLAETTDRAA
jgi:hypothetical protein